jgi:putative mRNA 3-end processing factor
MLSVTMTPAGLFVPELDLHLDPRGTVARAFISHAHADHAEGFGAGTLYASHETLSLMEARREMPAPGAARIAWDGAAELTLASGGTARLSLAPAGHMLGAAQLVIDHPGGRLVYTGDYQSGAGCTHPAGAPVPCDELVIESTFALPIFRFPPREIVRAKIVEFCRGALAEGRTPVLLAYSLGKAQELIHALVAAGVPVVAHGAAFRMCRAYEALGVPLGIGEGALRAYADEPVKRKKEAALGAALVVPPNAHAHPMVRKRADATIAYVSGWALIDASIERHRADGGFVLSDHADHDDLVATAQKSGARRVYTTLGDAEILASFLEHAETVALAAESIDTAAEPV